MNPLALYISSGGTGGLIATILVAGLVIWLIFYVLPLPAMVRTILAVVMAIVLVLMLLPGCSTMTAAQKTTLEQDAWNTVYAVGMGAANGALTGGEGQAIAGAVFAAASPSAIPKLVSDIAATNGATPAQASSLSAAATQATALLTSDSKVQAVNIIGSAIQTAASQSFSK